MRPPDKSDEGEQMGLAKSRQAHPSLETAYRLTQDFLQFSQINGEFIPKAVSEPKSVRCNSYHGQASEEEAPFAHRVPDCKPVCTLRRFLCRGCEPFSLNSLHKREDDWQSEEL